MSYRDEQRIEKLKDQLQNPGLTAKEIELIQQKIAVLQKAE